MEVAGAAEVEQAQIDLNAEGDERGPQVTSFSHAVRRWHGVSPRTYLPQRASWRPTADGATPPRGSTDALRSGVQV
jgi:hypothetical protein